MRPPASATVRARGARPVGRTEGRVVGVVCLEHIGPRRTWSVDEISFAGALGDQVALALAADDRHRLEREGENLRLQLLHVQKLESLGLMAGGVAHDFNNLLTVMTANLTFLQGRLGSADLEIAAAISDTLAAAQRSVGLTRQLLAYAGQGRVAVVPCDVNREISGLESLLGAAFSKRVTLALGGALPAVDADATQLQQLVMNLALNAAEAIGAASGTVTLSTSSRRFEAAKVEGTHFDYGLAPGEAVCIEVSDDAPGMSAAVLGRVFDPFFSTKGAGRGL
ncbi:MAG: hybrid sensor histidine kinase/response regulator [Myxococcales bacterium]|nr:hybrid sensor histidine kinase/response regulator [Myxococcales bacterium]